MPDFSTKTLFQCDAIRAIALTLADAPALQAFFERNPEYYMIASGRPPGPNEAVEELNSKPPADWHFSRQYAIGFVDTTASLVAFATLVSDLFVPGVWHIGFFMLETRQHGQGVAKALYEALEQWAHSQGAVWLRLGAIKGNIRAERFWERLGYHDVRERHGVTMGTENHTIRVMIKPLTNSTIADYLGVVARDRPESDNGN